MNRRHADPQELAQTSKLVAAWKRRVVEKADGNPLADEHWFAHLLSIARPVPRPVCDTCEGTGVAILDCTIHLRCNGRICEHRDKRSDQDWTHTYARACTCEAGRPFMVSFEKASHPEYPHAKPATRPTSYGGMTRATEGRR